MLRSRLTFAIVLSSLVTLVRSTNQKSAVVSYRGGSGTQQRGRQ